RILTRQAKQQVTDHRSTVTFDQAFHKRNGGWAIRGAGHFLADFAVKRLDTNLYAVCSCIKTTIDSLSVKIQYPAFDSD
ncbi:hypothetical protein QM259_19625, partial [Acinetobacter baumannii]|uniref:hypothetical protein n=1 Tax=Acinetobacter baumannii TaxID=470 RepID=UPI0024B67D0A